MRGLQSSLASGEHRDAIAPAGEFARRSSADPCRSPRDDDDPSTAFPIRPVFAQRPSLNGYQLSHGETPGLCADVQTPGAALRI